MCYTGCNSLGLKVNLYLLEPIRSNGAVQKVQSEAQSGHNLQKAVRKKLNTVMDTVLPTALL